LTQEQREVMLFVGDRVLTDFIAVMRDRLSQLREEVIFRMVQDLTPAAPESVTETSPLDQERQATWFHVRSVSDFAAMLRHDGVNPPYLTQEQREVPVLIKRGVLADFAAMLGNELDCQIQDTILVTLQGLREEASAASRAYNGPLITPSAERPAEPLCPQSICPVCYHELSEYCSLNCQEPVEPSTYRDPT